jgi:anaerobic magnesium-protoporphyrin IX monomethyl ester cyclase
MLITGDRAISVMTGRGCPYSCTFCASPALTRRRVAYHSIEYMERHIRFLIDSYGMKSLRIMDDTFTLNKRRVLEFCDMIERNGFKLIMTCLTNVKNADYDLFARMKQVGFIIVAFGLESGNDEILKGIEKGTTKAQCRTAVKAAYDAGLYVEGLFMIGHPGEMRSTIQQTIDFAKEINPDYVNWFQFSTPFPGSELWSYWQKHGTMRSMNWRLFDHQQPLFIPHGLDPQTLIAMRNEALQTCNQNWGNVVARHRQRMLAAAE